MSEYAPKNGYYALETQRIANGLPPWMKARRERDSNAQILLNPFAERLDDLNDQIELYLRNNFLELANLNEPDQIRRAQLPMESEFQYPTEVVNNLFNSSFEIQTSHDRIPDTWRTEGTGQAIVAAGIIGSRSISLSVTSGQWVSVYQESDVPIRAGVVWCFYVWYHSQATGLTAPATGFGLEVIGTYPSGATETLRVAFDADTSGYPKRATIRGSFARDVVKWKFRAIVTNSGPFPITTPVVVDAAMASVGNQTTDWRPNPFDNYPYINYYDRLSPVLSEYGVRSQFVERFSDFYLKAVPTRVGAPNLLSSGGTVDPVPAAGDDGFAVYSTAGSHREVDFWKDEWDFRFQLGYSGSDPRVRAYGVDAADAMVFDLAFRNYRNWFEDGMSWRPESMTAFNGYLLVVLMKLNHLGQLKRYLAIVDPKYPYPLPAYLEVIAMVELTGISLSLRLSRCEVRYSDQQWLYVGDGASTWVYRLYYDYFMVDYDRRTMYFREEYDHVVPQLIVPARTDSISVR